MDTTLTDTTTTTTTPPPAPVDTYILRKPIEVRGETLTKLEFRDCLVGSWIALDQFQGTERDKVAMIAICSPTCEMAATYIPKMGVRDFRAATLAMWAFLQSRIVPNEDGETTASLTLAAPLQTDKGPVTSLELREPVAQDLITIDPLSGVKKDVAAVVACSGLDRDVVMKLGVRDFLAGATWVADFFEDAPVTGA